MESNTVKKHKISLEDYPLKQDLENRLLMAQFTPQDLLVLEEILYSSITVPIKKLAKSTGLNEKALLPILIKLSRTGLLSLEEESVVVDKDLRKYFEGQVVRFDPDFKPGMEFIQNLLKKVPIHVLPIWYAIPRLSSDIFSSIVEKHLLTPLIFQRYLTDLNCSDPHLSLIVQEVYSSPDFKIDGTELMKKHQWTREKFEELMLLLEFHLVCCLRYELRGDRYVEVVTPFQEWTDYLLFLSSTVTPPLPSPDQVEQRRPNDLAFVQDLTTLLSSLPLTLEKGKWPLPLQLKELPSSYIERLMTKLDELKLAQLTKDRLYALENATGFLELSSEDQALFLYRHPLSRELLSPFATLLTDRTLRETEKSILRVLDAGWVDMETFLKGVSVSLGEHSTVSLKKQGKTWKYALPAYSDEELAFIRSVVLEWLFELGITSVGSCNGKECFRVTALGKSLFGQE